MVSGLLNTTDSTESIEGIEGVPTEEQAMGVESKEPFNEQVEPHIREQMDEQQNAELSRVLEAGMKLLFGAETHDKLFSNIRPEDEVPIEDELGAAATSIMLMMFEKSGQSMPGEVIIPSGVILLARAVDYINEAQIAQVNDEKFGLAIEMFTDNIRNKLDPEFAEQAGTGGGTSGEAVPEAEDSLGSTDSGDANSGGLLAQ